MTATDTIDDTRPRALQDAAFAALRGSASSKAAKALVAAVCAQVAAFEDEHGTKKYKPGQAVDDAVGAFVADLLVAQSGEKPRVWMYRSLHAKGFSGGPVGHRVFIRVLGALKGLGLVEHAAGVAKFVNFGSGPIAYERKAARFKATPSLLQLATRYRVPLQSANTHFSFKYELPNEPLQKRKAKLTQTYTSRQVGGLPMTFDHTETSRKLEADVRELNEFLARQHIEGGVHQGYVRIFQNGDDPSFNWDYGGRLYSRPGDTNYQILSQKKRLKMRINGQAVAEVDLRASYLTIFHALHGAQLDLNSDPYRLPGFGEAGRDVVKRWMVATFGSPKPISQWPTALLKGYKDDNHKPLDRKRYPVKLVREEALAQHPLMARWGEPFNGRVLTWGDLMFRESVVVVSTMLELMRDHDIPSLAIHDSLLVPQSAINTTATVLKARFRSVTQQEVQLTYKPKGVRVTFRLLGT
jgi:hypothetical protein